MRFGHLKVIAEQDERLSKLATRLSEHREQTALLKQKRTTLQQDLFELEKRLKLLNTQKQNLTSIGESGDKYDIQIDELEGKGFTLLESIDDNDKELHEGREFESGLENTINEIGQEAGNIKAVEDQALTNLTMRLSLLEEELPPPFKEVLKKLQAKNLAHGPFTRNEGGHCYFCRYKISRIDESEIDLQQQLKQCPQCSRIFLPYGS